MAKEREWEDKLEESIKIGGQQSVEEGFIENIQYDHIETHLEEFRQLSPIYNQVYIYTLCIY